MLYCAGSCVQPGRCVGLLFAGYLGFFACVSAYHCDQKCTDHLVYYCEYQTILAFPDREVCIFMRGVLDFVRVAAGNIAKPHNLSVVSVLFAPPLHPRFISAVMMVAEIAVLSSRNTSQPSKPDADLPVPQRWALWAEDLAYEAATKRLLRELRHLFGGLDALAPTAPNMAFALESLGDAATAGAAGGTKPALLEAIRAAAAGLCDAYGLSARALTAAAAGALCHASAGGSRRLGALCLLLNALDRSVAVDAAVCAAAGRLVQCCSAHGQAHLEDLSLRAAHARALGTEAEAAKEEANAKALSEAENPGGGGGGGGGRGGRRDAPERARPAGSFITAAVAAATAERKAAAARVAEAAAAEAAGGMGLENLRPHLSELRSAAFQLELCLALHARGCLRLSCRARAQAAVGFRAGLLVEALGRRCVPFVYFASGLLFCS